MSSTENKRIVIAGCGEISALGHIPNTAADPRVGEIVLVDPRSDLAAGLVAEWRDRTDAGLVALEEIANVEGPVDGVIVAAAPDERYGVAMDAIRRLGADVLLETGGGMTYARMLELVRAAEAEGVSVQMPYHHLLAAAGPLAWLETEEAAEALDGRWTADFGWHRRRSSSHEGSLENLGPHGIAEAVAIAGWVPPDRVRAWRDGRDAYAVHLEFAASRLRLATIEVAGKMPMPSAERVGVCIAGETRGVFDLWLPAVATPSPAPSATSILVADAGRRLSIGSVATLAEVGAKQSRLWIDSLGSAPLLPVDGQKALIIEAVLDAARESSAQGGRPVRPRLDETKGEGGHEPLNR